MKKAIVLMLGIFLLSNVECVTQKNRKAEEERGATEKENLVKQEFLEEKKPSFHVEEWEKGLNERQPPVLIMDAMGVRPGMIVGEVGAGSGRMTMWLAERVGEKGMVYANDIDKEALEQLRQRCKRDGFKNVKTIVGKMEDPELPINTLDIAFMINVYHHVGNPVSLIRNIHPSLKPGGILAIVECDPHKVDWGEEHGCASKDEMIDNLKKAGFEVIRIELFLGEDNLYIAKPIISF